MTDLGQVQPAVQRPARRRRPRSAVRRRRRSIPPCSHACPVEPRNRYDNHGRRIRSVRACTAEPCWSKATRTSGCRSPDRPPCRVMTSTPTGPRSGRRGRRKAGCARSRKLFAARCWTRCRMANPARWLYAPMREYPSRPGKALRPALCLSAGRVFGASSMTCWASQWQLSCCTTPFWSTTTWPMAVKCGVAGRRWQRRTASRQQSTPATAWR